MESELGANVRNISYLHARDPSILAYNRACLTNVRTNLMSELGEKTVEEPSKKQNDENLRVYLRVKIGYSLENLYKISDDTLECNVPPGSKLMRNIRDGDSVTKLFSFTKIFPPETNQTEIFNSIVKPKILDFINGHNSTLLAYGASGSGKTFTVIGTDEEPGIIPRSLEYLFKTLPQLSQNPIVKPLPSGSVTSLNKNQQRKERSARKFLLDAASSLSRNQHVQTYTAMQQRLSGEPVATLETTAPDVSLAVWVSFAEIYNEQIYDLLLPDPPRGQQRARLRLGCSNGHTYIKDLTYINVTSGLEAYQILQYGIHNVNYAATNLNTQSSRSHSIFTIKLVQVPTQVGDSVVNMFNFCDLAGCERTKKTMNVGDRLKESTNINTSLLVLGRCISAVRDLQKKNDNKVIPYRESKLTQLFQRALGGNEDIGMIVTINPAPDMFEETQHVLNFSAVAQEISITESKPVFKKTRLSMMAQQRRSVEISREKKQEDVEQLHETIFLLQTELERVRNECEMMEKINREYMLEGYDRLMNRMMEAMETREREIEELARRQCDLKIKKIRAHYEQLLQDKNEEVVVISSDEDNQDLKTELKKKIRKLEMANARLEVENQTINEQIKMYKDKAEEHQNIVSEGVGSFLQMEDRNEELEKENHNLKKICLELQIEVERLQNIIECQTRATDSPEEEELSPIPQPSDASWLHSLKKCE